MKKNTKIITLILSALLLIGCAIGIMVSAEEPTPTVTVKYKNISYEGAPKVLYAVEATNVPEGAEVKMAFFDTMPTSEDATPDYLQDECEETLIIGGVEYKAFFSDGIAPKNMRKNIYAVPVILEGGKLIARGDVVTYSIFTYGINMLSKTPTAEQKALYTSLLDYGASVQRVLLDSGDYTEEELALAGGYADEYYAIKLNTLVDGELTKSDMSYFGFHETATLDAAKLYGGALFNGFTDAEGNTVGQYGENTAVSWNKCTLAEKKIGITEYNCNYTSEAYVYTYEDEGANAKTYASLGGNTTLDEATLKTITTDNGEYTYTHTAVATLTKSLSDSTALQLSKIRKVTASTDPSVAVGSQTPQGNLGNTSVGLSNKKNATSVYDVEYHVFETDLYVDSIGNPSNTPFQFFFKNSSNLWTWNVNSSSAATGTFSISVRDGDDKGKTIKGSIPQCEWVNIRVEIYPVANSDDISFKVYVNGEFTGTTYKAPAATAACENDADYKLTDVSILALGSIKDATIALDNTVFYTKTKPVADYYGKGLYVNDEATNGLDEDDARNYASVSAATIADENGNKVLNFEKANGTSASLEFPIYATGEKFIFETDIRWNGYTEKSDNWLGRFGFTTPDSRDLANDAPYVKMNAPYVTSDGDLYFNNRDNVSVCPILRTGVWYNLRVEYVPMGYDEATGKYLGNEYFYVNNELLLTYENVPFASDSSNCYNFRFGFRSANGFSLTLDNIYVGYESGHTDYFGQGVYYEQSYKYGANDNGVGAGKIIAKAETTTTLSNVLEGENYALKLAKKYDGTYLSSNKLWFNVNADAATLTEGQSYVFETDFKWLGSTANYEGYRCAQFGFVPTVGSATMLGQNYFYPTTSANPSINHLYYDVDNATDGYYNTSKIDKDITLNSEFIFEANVWYNIRFEYTPTGTDDSGNYTAIQRFYVNNVLVYKGTVASATNNTNAAAFLITAKKYSGEMNMLFDNTYGGVVTSSAQ